MEYLIELIETTELPIVLTVTNQAFATSLCEQFNESQIQLMNLDYTSEDLVVQIQVRDEKCKTLCK
jgi:hypothetical protein